MRIAVHVTAMNRPATLRATLRAAVDMSARGGLETALTVVDNGSRDEEALAFLGDLERVAGVRVIRNSENLGLSRAVNQGLAAGAADGADVLVHLDDDALVGTPDWDLALSRYFSHPTVGLVVTNPAGVGIPKGGDLAPPGSVVLPGALAEPAGPPYREVSWGLGMCWAIRRSAYDEVGGYDPQLLHQNECDLALRVRLAGFEVAGVGDVAVAHNEPGGPRSDLSLAREHLGCVQFRDKWCQYFNGAGWTYGTMPLSLMPHWPPDRDLLRRFAEYHGVDLNPPPGVPPALGPGAALGLTPDNLATAAEAGGQIIEVGGARLLVYRVLQNDFSWWERGDGYHRDREKAIARWRELTGEEYTGYRWPAGRLKP